MKRNNLLEDEWLRSEIAPHAPEIRRWLRKRFPTIADVDEIIQDGFVRMVDRQRKSPIAHPKPFLFAVCRNLAIDYYRKGRRSPQMVRENEEYDIFNTINVFEDNIEDRIIKEENARYVRELIKKIPEKQREVLIMRHYAGMSFKEIAEVQGVNINTALGRMRYALR